MHLLLSLIVLVCAPVTGWALPEDTQQPIHVQADTVEIDDRRGVSVYQGNVHLTQGSIVLTADKLTVYHPKRQLEKAIAEGNPAHYKQDLDTKGSQVRAQSSTMEYSATQRVLVLSGGAHVWQDGNEFRGSRVEYDLKTDVVHARRGDSAQERVEVTIQPNKRRSQ
jgi:lipopolysaccharide export system protein LptA